MKTILTTLAAVALATAIGGAVVVYSGIIDVAADTPHAAPLHALLETTRKHAIAARAKDIEVPGLDAAELVRSGAGNYDAMCIGCHLAPGVASSELSQALYPAPPNLAKATADGDPATRFWIIKHGIKSTGMPAWGKSMDDRYIWGLVAFLERLPSLSAQEYQSLVASSAGHQHGGGESDRHAPGTAGHEAGTSHAGHPHPAEPEAATVHRHADGSQHRH